MGRIGRVALTAATLGCVATASLAGTAHAADPATVKVTIDDKGCPATLKAKAGATTFVVTNKGTGGVSEFEIVSTAANAILGEVENIPAGKKAEFTISLKAGDYKTACPGGTTTPLGDLTVSGTADTTLSPAGQAAVDQYRAYLVDQTAQLTAATKVFTAAVDAKNIDAAKAAYLPARIPYERIEPVAEAFGDLDPRIDAREGDVPAKDWGGYHVIEKALWKDGSLSAITPQITADLNTNVQTLQNLVQDVELQPAAIANGAVELLNEVSKSKITGEEERYSHIDLVDFKANVEGAEASYEAVKPILEQKNPKLAAQLDAKFAAVYAALVPYETGNGTYVLYNDLKTADTKKLSQVIDSLAEPLSKLSKQVVGQ
jgi:iron uptake system EfeUOB component EfeO/EfeM